MAGDPKSLAAEIEAVLRDQIVLRWMGPDSFIEGHEEAARQIVARIAALQSRAFEDRARWMRERAAGCAIAWRVRPEKAFRAGFRPQQVSIRNAAAEHIAAAISALPLQPEGERNA